jgi:hypothetical protein
MECSEVEELHAIAVVLSPGSGHPFDGTIIGVVMIEHERLRISFELTLLPLEAGRGLNHRRGATDRQHARVRAERLQTQRLPRTRLVDAFEHAHPPLLAQ